MSNVIKIENGLDLESAYLLEGLAIRDDFSTVIINNSLDGIITFDRECRYTLWSPAMEKITGLSSADVIGKYAFDLFPFLVQEGIDQLYYSSLRGEASPRSKIISYNWTAPLGWTV
jgi:PAS domain S-box-containing protein